MSHRRGRSTALATAVAVVSLPLVAVTGQAGAAPAAMARQAGAAATPAHPFPTHVTYKTGVMPSASQSARDAAVTKQYGSWKSKYLRAACGGYLVYATGDAPNKGTVSEAQGYGMNIVPLMAGYDADAKTEFDGLWHVVSTHRDSQGMMEWKIDGSSCKYADSGTPDAATDGDLDVGYGLILADRQWGGYTSAAKDWLAKLYAADVASDGHLKCEDDGPNTDTRPSDHMLDHLRAFAAYDTAHDWNKVVTRTEAVIKAFTAKYSPTANLLSDFVVKANTSSPQPAPADYQESQPDNIVGYNSVRVPWHMGTDALLYGSSVSVGVATKESASYKSHAGGDPAKIYPHTKLDGSPTQTDDQSEAANDPVGVAAMAAGDQAWTDKLWNFLATNPYGDTYYGETIKMLVYIVMAGDYWSPAS
ncbi:glycosyl hydrolase family 8 [Actinoallomurus sp. NPDC050550]|uniref:glycosyl hydrolase family 8 n=1 Tax=Actinoallomurus sp. NPDC050550 TaxID=3154937 RepID=UPI0033C320FE